MTRMDYALIAAAIKYARPSLGPGHSATEGIAADAHDRILDRLSVRMADALSGTNPAFDKSRFLAACGWE